MAWLYSEDSLRPASRPWQKHLFEVIFEADTPAGRGFDVVLLVLIVTSVLAVCMETVDSFAAHYGQALHYIEWGVTGIFTLEYSLRIACVRDHRRYLLSFYGLVDFLSILPTWLGLFIPGSHALVVVRTLRLLRIFRIFKLTRFITESSTLSAALVASRHKIAVFLFAVMTIVVIIGALMHLVEGDASGFTNIPISIYWAIVTLTTVGYGDISPVTPTGRFLASLVMILGYGIIAVPTGIVTAELTHVRDASAPRACPGCGRTGHDPDAAHCKYCGDALE